MSIESECDHVMCFFGGFVIALSDIDVLYALSQIPKKIRHRYCPRCGVKLAPIFKALEEEE